MTEARWKLVVDQDGVTIAGDRFQLTTAPREFAVDDAVFGVSEPAEMEAIVSEIDSMTRRTYGQYCAISRAMEVLGERWASLIIRDLLVSSRTAADLRAGLPRIPGEVLAARLRELERADVIRREVNSSTDTVVYEVTEWGRELEEIMVRLGRWGVRLLGDPRPEDVYTVSALVLGLRAVFQPEQAKGVKIGFELRVLDFVAHAVIEDGTLVAGEGPIPDPDLVIEAGYAITSLMSGDLSPADALTTGAIRLIGDPALFSRFTKIFLLQHEPAIESAA